MKERVLKKEKNFSVYDYYHPDSDESNNSDDVRRILNNLSAGEPLTATHQKEPELPRLSDIPINEGVNYKVALPWAVPPSRSKNDNSYESLLVNAHKQIEELREALTVEKQINETLRRKISLLEQQTYTVDIYPDTPSMPHHRPTQSSFSDWKMKLEHTQRDLFDRFAR
jgi:hypothetical protein